MHRNFFLLLVLLPFIAPARATVMQYAFTGEVTDVQNDGVDFWDPDEVIGSNITGYIWYDTSVQLNGREETFYYWWENIEQPPGPLTSQFNVDNQRFDLTDDYDLDPVSNDYTVDEWITVYNGPNFDGVPIPDALGFSDQERYNQYRDNGEPYEHKYLYLRFVDYINDLLVFPDGLSDDTPNLVQEFSWTDMDLSSDEEQRGYGEFWYSQGIGGQSQGSTDSQLEFVLSEVVATVWTPDNEAPPVDEVPAPAPLTVVAGSVLFWWLYRRQLHPGFGACSMRGGR